jgi:2-polyprenyl-3-methyl-5-hydroxy-6-metoxy-1,4-benzoquinol methylase
MSNVLVKLIGWKATVLHGDPCVFDRWRWLKRHLLPGPLRTLDAGCGSGAFTMYASKIGNESVGISFDERNHHVAQVRARILRIPNVQFIQADLRDLDTLSDRLGKFDQILCLETIEHIRNDKKLIADMSALLKPGGRLLLTTPSKDSKPLVGDKLSKDEDGGHVRWGYTHSEMRELSNECGLDILAEEFISGFISQQLTNLMRILSKVNAKIAWVATFPFRLFQVLDSPLTRLMGYPHLCIGVVGVKR